MGLYFKPRFNVLVKHDYYRNGTSEDFDIVPLVETKNYLQQTRQRVFVRENSIAVFYAARDFDGLDPIAPLEQFTYRFGLKLNNKTTFENITKVLDPSTSAPVIAEKSVCFKADFNDYTPNVSNQPSGNEHNLTLDLIERVRPTVFNHESDLQVTEGDTGRLEILDANDDSVLVTINNLEAEEDGKFRVSIDFNKLKLITARYKLRVISGALDDTKVVFVSDEAHKQNFFGFVEITSNATTEFYDFGVQFQRKEILWKYIVVDTGRDPLVPVDFSDVVIEDVSLDDGTNVYDNYTFTMNTTELEVSGDRAIAYLSDEKIPYYQIPKKKLILKNTSGTQTILINNLSNPLPTSVVKNNAGVETAEIFVFV